MNSGFQVDLLDILAEKSNCRYLSDLRYLLPWERKRLAREIEKIPPEAASLSEWNHALEYLAKEQPACSCKEARTKLIMVLSSWQANKNWK